jgi:hypothetical protein
MATPIYTQDLSHLRTDLDSSEQRIEETKLNSRMAHLLEELWKLDERWRINAVKNRPVTFLDLNPTRGLVLGLGPAYVIVKRDSYEKRGEGYRWNRPKGHAIRVRNRQGYDPKKLRGDLLDDKFFPKRMAKKVHEQAIECLENNIRKQKGEVADRISKARKKRIARERFVNAFPNAEIKESSYSNDMEARLADGNVCVAESKYEQGTYTLEVDFPTMDFDTVVRTAKDMNAIITELKERGSQSNE